MNHGDAAILIPEMHHGRLDEALRSEVAEHVERCDDCRRLLSVYESVALASRAPAEALDDPSGGRNGDAQESHPDIETLVLYAMEPGSVPPEDRSRIERHATRCAACADEIGAIREAERAHHASAPGETPSEPRIVAETTVGETISPVWRRVALLAAGVILALLANAAYLVGWRLPAAEREITRLAKGSRDAGAPAPGAVGLPLFGSTVRAGDTGLTVHVGDGAAMVPLAVAPRLPAATDDAALHRFEVIDSGGSAIFTHEIRSGELRRLAAASGAFAILVPGASFSGTDHTLRLTNVDTNTVLIDQPFSVVHERGETQ